MMVAFHNFKRIHLVGVGGIGMSGIAEVLLTLGYSVSGSDLKSSALTERLQNAGAEIFEGHRAEQVQGAHVVVVSSAIPRENPEIAEAIRLKIPVIPRAEMLAELMRLKYGIAVAGAHGKTTTTSMTASVLAVAGLDPTFVVGGRVNHIGATARLGRGDYMVVEADESDRTFLLLATVVAVVTTIDREHLDTYKSLAEIQEAFTQFVNRVPFYGAAVLSLDEPNVQAIIPNVKRPVITYGMSNQADLVISEIELDRLESAFRLIYRGDDLGQFHLNGPPGIHNVRNAAAAARRFQGRANFGGMVAVIVHQRDPIDDALDVEPAAHAGKFLEPHADELARHVQIEAYGCCRRGISDVVDSRGPVEMKTAKVVAAIGQAEGAFQAVQLDLADHQVGLVRYAIGDHRTFDVRDDGLDVRLIQG